VPFNDPVHYDTTSATFPGTTFPPGCITCHDVSAPSTKVGPVCQTCHVAASPLAAVNCTSCHAVPPDGGAPAGAAYPNIEGAHAGHIALAGAGTCDTCHNGLGSGTLNHYNRAKSRLAPGDVLFLATYDAQSGPSSFDNAAALSCSNVSCHGGQATPNWRTGAINVDTQCSSCHAQGTSQFNSYNSGEHQRHVGDLGLLCTFCHNTTSLAVNHFTALGTPAMEGPASATIGGGSTLIPAGNYDPATQSCSPNTGICHGTRTW
jgi:predicted CxxxxCH...CXXCH cytochrome family protein